MIHVRYFNFSNLKEPPTVKKSKGSKISYINAPFAFDIETTSYIDNDGNKRSFMYIFMFNLNGTTVYGREWADFFYTLNSLQKQFKLNEKKQLVIYVHNLPYEFQFLQGRCNISNVFAREARHPMKCTVNEVFEFRCSYILSGLSLAKTAENVTIHKIRKMTGDLDYKKIRTSQTPLTPTEMRYCEYDVKVLYWYIRQEILGNDNNIAKIPLTKTGYVRRYCYDKISADENFKLYRYKLKQIAPVDVEMFTLLHKCFAGGFTHANVLHVGEVCENVGSIDFTSSYPAQMVRHKYPMGKFKKIVPKNRQQFENIVSRFACIIEIAFKDITATEPNHTISASKCKFIDGGEYDNGRVVSAKTLWTYVTDVDYKNILKFYKIGAIHIEKMYYTAYDYLPDSFVKCVLGLFADKTTLKGVKGKEQEYLLKKGMLNSCYGMTVTNPVNNEISFTPTETGGEWAEEEVDPLTALNDIFIKKYNQFLVYQWGVWVTAWARHELYTAVLEMGIDVVYCDTDSVKYVNPAKYDIWIDTYNARVLSDMYMRCDMLGVSREMCEPKTQKGNRTPLGIFDREKTYKNFKTLGAKRYMYSYDGNDINITVSGLNKTTAVPYIKWYSETHNITPFEFFDNDMYIPAKWVHSHIIEYPTGKNTLTYIDDPYTDRITDYLGNTATVSENTYIHMCEQDYSLSMTDEFINYINDFDVVSDMPNVHKPKFLKIKSLEK